MQFKPTLAAVSLAVAAFITGAPAAQAAVIDFNGLGGTDMPGNYHVARGVYTNFEGPSTASGYKFTTTPDSYGYPSNHWYASPLNAWLFCGGTMNDCAINGTDYLIASSTLKVQRADNAAFTLTSLELGQYRDFDAVPLAEQFIIKGTRIDGSIVTQAVMLDSVSNADGDNDFNRFDFTNFNNLAFFDIVYPGGDRYDGYALDNLIVNADGSQIPEPGVPAMLAVAAAAFLWQRRLTKTARLS